MTQLSPEENQGGGDDHPGGDSLDSEDELDSTLAQNSASLSLEAEDLSPPLPSSSVPVPSLKPVLDDKILAGLDKQSPRRLSVDLECESVTSDYSELGGPLQEIERDLHYVDREFLRGGSSSPLSHPGFRNVRHKDPGFVCEEEETEAEREWKLRKINFLSLAQEFAELKKVDAKACPINFHRNQSVKAFANSPLGSRCQSLERRSGRTHSRSPMRVSEKSTTKDYPKNIGNMIDASGGAAISHPSLPKNYERKLLAKEVFTPPVEDLPVNEARRRNSNTDLPANMRPDRCGNAPGVAQKARKSGPGGQAEAVNSTTTEGCGEGEGDFEVYNIETALTNLNWQMLEEQLETVTRLEACRNDREEIRRRLAMAVDDENVDKGDSDEPDTDVSSLTRKRLQDRLQTAASGMQICFMNDDDYADDAVVDEENYSGQKEMAPPKGQSTDVSENEPEVLPPNHPCFPGEIEMFTSKQTKLQSEATLALAQASTMAHMQLEVDKQMRKKSPIADMVGIPALGSGRRLHLKKGKLQEMNIAQLQVLVNDLHSQIELLNEDLVHLLIERDDLHMEQDSMLVDIEDLTSHCHDPTTTNNNKSTHNNNRPVSRRDRRT